jgi:PAS domain S-box-containing protein
MKSDYKTKAQLLQELEEMRQKVSEVDSCRIEYENVRNKYEKLLDSAPDALVFVGSDKKIVMTNAQFEKLFGYGHHEVLGKDLDILIPRRFRERHRHLVSGFFTNPIIRHMGSGIEIYGLKKDGEEFPADISLSLLNTDEGLLVSAAIRDITKRKEAEDQIEMNYIVQKVINSMLKVSLEPLTLEKQFDRILDLILSVPYLSLESKGAISLVESNPGVLVLKAQHGFSESDPVPCKSVPLGQCLCGKAASSADTIFADHENDRHEFHFDDSFPHGHYCVPIKRGGNGGKVIGLLNVYVKQGHKRNKREEEFLTSVANTLAGIIERDRAEKEKIHLQEQLAQAEKLTALGRFTANVAHEIRNPLTSVGGFARRLDKTIPEGTKEKEYATFIITEVKRLEGILKNVLSYSRESSPRLKEHNIHEIIDRVLMMNEEMLMEKSITVHKSYGDVTPIFIDADQVLEVLENLVLNAIDAMSEGGNLHISTAIRQKRGFPYLDVRIEDTGEGIPDEQLEIIFEPFYTTKVTEKGTGLGLSISKKIMEALGGVIYIESEVGKGSIVNLYFPYKTDPKTEE